MKTSVMPTQAAVGRPPMAVLWCALVVPYVLMSAKLASSLAVGTTLAALVALLAGLSRKHRLPCVRSATPWLLVALLAIGVHLIFAGRLAQVDLMRAFGSAVVLSIVWIGAASLADLLARVPPARLRRLVRHAMLLTLGLGLWGSLGILQPFAGSYSKPVFPFTEPSHFGLFLAPLLIAACVLSSPRERIFFIGIALIETAALQNTTMAVACLLAAIICLPLRHVTLLALIAVPAIATLDLTYYASRLDFSEDNNNLSTLVFLQGWQMLDEAWRKTGGFGLGFQQLGLQGSEVDAAVLIRSLVGDDLNLLDGGFNLAKLVSEFGVIGVALTGAYVVAAIRAVLILRATVTFHRDSPPLLLVAASVIVAYSVELALRGAGYFTPTGLFVLSAMFIWLRRSRTGAQSTGSHSTLTTQRIKP